MLLRLAFLVALVPLLGVGCGTAPVADGAPDVMADGTVRLAPLDAVRMGGHEIQFMEVVEDSRCPEGVQCVRAGRARIRVAVDGLQQTLSIPHAMMREGETSTVTVRGLTISAISLFPYPTTESTDEPVEAVLEITQ